MKIKKLAILLCSFTALSFIACKSTPAAEEAPVVEEEVKEEPKEETPVVEEPKQETPVVEAPKDFSEANKKLFEKVESARTAAIEAEAKKYFPEIFAATENTYSELKKNVNDNSGTDYSTQIADLTARYESLEKAAKAKALREQIDNLGLNEFDKAAYDKAAAAMENYEALSSKGSGSELLAQANSAYDSFNQLLLKGYSSLIKTEKDEALAAKKNAESVKAQLAKKQEYKNATEIFQKADIAKNYNNIADKKTAYEGFKSAKTIYTEIYEIVKKNREAAQAKIDQAKKKVEESASYSVEADAIAPLTDKVAGIEDENAVLLEKDKFANPDDAIINVEETSLEDAK